MKFSNIYIEEQVEGHPIAEKILSKFRNIPIQKIRKVEDVWGRVKKPYLQKRDELNIFIGKKEGALVKEAPEAYGHNQKAKHYYFIHAYNCIYECEYCYLQGHFHSPDLVFFVNHDEMANEMYDIYQVGEEQEVWFHAGEFSDSLALSHITSELPYYFDVFKQMPNAKLELRTKSNNIKELLKLTASDNIIISFSLAPRAFTKEFDHKTPGVRSRFEAIKELIKKGYRIGIHLDPIMAIDNFENEYEVMVNDLAKILPAKNLEYISLGVVRFTSKVYAQFEKNYPQSQLVDGHFIKGEDGLVRYPRTIRLKLIKSVNQFLLNANFPKEKIYFCMEDE